MQRSGSSHRRRTQCPRYCGSRYCHFGLATMAMGDLNATVFAQEGHVALLREHGGLEQAEMITYRGTFPAGDVAEGVMIDDHAVVAQVPATRGWQKAAAARRGAPRP